VTDIPDALSRERWSLSICVVFLIFGGLLPSTNIARHAEATEVKISLEHCDQSIRLTIEDNGKGPPNHTGDTIHSPSLGMVDMRARARHSGGELTAISIMLQGLRIEVVVPLQTQPA